MFDHPAPTDEPLDARLKAVALPDGLLARLRQVPDWGDEQLDEQLRNVPLPMGLTARLQRVVHQQQVDEQLSEVALPEGLLGRLRSIPLRRARPRLVGWAAAAALFAVITGGYLAGLSAFLAALRLDSRPEAHLVIDAMGGQEPQELLVESLAEDGSQWIRMEPEAATGWTAEPAPEGIALADWKGATRTGPAGQLWEELQAGLPLSEHVLLLRWKALGAPYSRENERAGLQVASLPAFQGVEPPLVPGYDRKFWLQHGIHPPVFPAVQEPLQTCSVPLNSSTESYERIGHLAAAGRLPSPAEIRVEHFLAAMDYRFPSPGAGQVGIRTAAGPSVFAPSGTGLLQVGVKAGPLARGEPAATHLTVALDISANMAWAERLPKARQALQRLLDCLAERDRLSLVVFNDQLVHHVEAGQIQGGAGPQSDLAELLKHLRPHGAADVEAGLRQALARAASPTAPADVSRRLVLISSSDASGALQQGEAVRSLLGQAIEQGLEVTLLELGDDEQTAAGELARVAADAGGQLQTVRTADQLHWALLEALTGRDTVVAADALLRVTFNPQTVAAYRLLGHEASPLPGQNPVTVEAHLHAGQAASALFEVWLRPGSEDDVAWAEVVWKDPADGQARRVEQRISRLQFASSFAAAPLSLQAAAVAAETAEVLRQSFQFHLEPAGGFATRSKPRNLQGVLDVVQQVNPRLSSRPDFQGWVELIEQIEQARLYQGGGKIPLE